MAPFITKEQIKSLASDYYLTLKKALDFQKIGDISSYTRNMIKAQQLQDQLKTVPVTVKRSNFPQ